jgi:hypothetical protein
MATNIIAQTVATPKVLVQAQLTTTLTTVLGTVPASSSWSIKSAFVCNTTGTVATITLDINGNGAARRALSSFVVAANDTVSLADIFSGLQLTAGDTIVGGSGTATALTLTISGVEAS